MTSNAWGLCKPNTSVNITKKTKEEISFHYLPKGPTAEGNHPDSVTNVNHWMLKLKFRK